MRYAALWIAGVIVAVFGLQQLIGSDPFVLDVSLMWFEPWRIVLSMVAHSDVVHLLGNLFSLLLFGLILEGTIGARRVLALFLIAGLGVAFLTPFMPYDRVIGASGAIFGIIGALTVLRPRLVIWLDFVPMPMLLAALVYVAMDFFGVFYPSGTANVAHLFGMAIGLAAGFWWRAQGFADRPIKPLGSPRRSRNDPSIDHALDAYERDHGLR